MKILRCTTLGMLFSVISTSAFAQLNSQGVLDQVVTEVASKASSWQTIIADAASWLFWTLAVISMVWTFGMMALRKADIGEFFAELVRFTIFTGFFWWLLMHGPEIANSIIKSMAQLGEQAAGVSSITPSGIVDVGFLIWKQAISNLSAWSPVDSLVGVVLSAGILILLALVAVNLLLVFASAWLFAYAGIFFLGFGGSRWTSDMAINYYKTVLGIAVQIMTMVLLVGIGNDMLATFYAKMSKNVLNFEELGVMLVFCMALLVLVNRLPSLVAGVITGSSISSAGSIGNFGAGAAVGAAMTAAGMATGGAALAAKAAIGATAGAMGGASAIQAAFQKASASMTDIPRMDAVDTGAGDAGSSETGSSPFAEAAGFGGGYSGNSLARAAKVETGTAGELAQAGGGAIKQGERVNETAGGRLAGSVRATGGPFAHIGIDDTSEADSLGDEIDEVADFVRRGKV